ncbi:FAD-dependent monooxygenase [Vibrio sp. M60_M31a]
MSLWSCQECETEEELSKPENMPDSSVEQSAAINGKHQIYPSARLYPRTPRLAGKFREGRILLAGDAAHDHASLARNRVTTRGMRDANNLGVETLFSG